MCSGHRWASRKIKPRKIHLQRELHQWHQCDWDVNMQQPGLQISCSCICVHVHLSVNKHVTQGAYRIDRCVCLCVCARTKEDKPQCVYMLPQRTVIDRDLIRRTSHRLTFLMRLFLFQENQVKTVQQQHGRLRVQSLQRWCVFMWLNECFWVTFWIMRNKESEESDILSRSLLLGTTEWAFVHNSLPSLMSWGQLKWTKQHGLSHWWK